MTKPKQPNECENVYDFLDQVRLRPGMWVAGSSLTHLDSMLRGYRVAMEVHGAKEALPFWAPGEDTPFDSWLNERNGRASSLRWSTQIEREAKATGIPAIELFFTLLDQFRAESQ
ncbi:hypothetical protein R6L23_02460 [Streptomyces sp. SR27]|uniref:hypothetical protein n=1 Tax=Streptomyces sp. SR27 TaxID=3076630 RepID=UPI00295B74ED|nr:hypothetical protein [Streptomyces sp. SR27]MDV9187089.1 hypothetical protein [Streptomyces sp. SR27]